MLTQADDFPIHQTPEPIAYAGSDRNFYDRYWFNGFEPDGSLFFLIGMGIYPHLNIIDCAISVQIEGKQYSLRGSRILEDRMDISVGPMRLEVVKPLWKLRFVCEEQEGIAADLTITGRAFPIEEPRFTRRIGTRGFMDYTRLTQNGHWSGWISIDGRKIELSPQAMGTRDRSWGIRPIGLSDPQPNVNAGEQGYFWQWTPLNFKDKSLFFHIAAEPNGHIWNKRSVLCPDGTGGPANFRETESAHLETTLVDGTLWPEHGILKVDYGDGEYKIELEPFHRMQMKGIGYFHPEWFHGRYHGVPIKVAREDFTVDDLDPMAMQNFHVQRLSRLTLTNPDGSQEQSIGAFEQAILGAYEPMGIKSNMDIARWDRED
ncbi:hypothetical protein [Sphingobium boeckii]|uniref:Hydroxyneurosporene synthase (CrtC) n=1 Tax=Sphingobium boeckii TaxID=1082345 RepID=A0A7W9AHV9_9SPHN|nr:hypothetical protein [Sphingobium boeckii]MBB5685873.1 hypothetical protein [Sphingobium boeckii]